MLHGRTCPYRRDIDRCFGYRPNKDFYVALHNKKETRGSLLSACFFLALILIYRTRMSLWFTISQTSLGNIGSSYVRTLHQPPFKFFGSTFLERKVEKHKTQSNFSKQLAAELIGGFGREVGGRDIEYRACARRALGVKAYHGSCASDEHR